MQQSNKECKDKIQHNGKVLDNTQNILNIIYGDTKIEARRRDRYENVICIHAIYETIEVSL